MNIRRVQTRIEGPRLFLRFEAGHATVPMILEYEIDPATALVLAGHLEAAVHAACPHGLSPLSIETQPINPS